MEFFEMSHRNRDEAFTAGKFDAVTGEETPSPVRVAFCNRSSWPWCTTLRTFAVTLIWRLTVSAEPKLQVKV